MHTKIFFVHFEKKLHFFSKFYSFVETSNPKSFKIFCSCACTLTIRHNKIELNIQDQVCAVVLHKYKTGQSSPAAIL